jgi:ABC-type arginine transport system permease subunit
MWLKIIILVLFVGILISLSSALGFLLKDTQVPESKRTLYALGIRITLAVLMMLCIFYGFYSGILHSQAPWDHRI